MLFTIPQMILIIPRLSSNLSDRLSARIYHDVRTSNPIVIGYGYITLEELLDGDGGREGIYRTQFIIFSLRLNNQPC